MAIKTFTAGSVLTASDTNTYLANSGLVYVTSATVSGASAVQINNCFTSTYQNYVAVFNGTTTATAGGYDLAMRFCAGGTPNTTSNYFAFLNYATNASTTWAFYWQSAINTGTAGYGANLKTMVEMTIFSPQETGNTAYKSTGVGFGSSTSGSMTVTGLHYANTQFDGIQLYQAGFTMTGTLTIYGVRKP